MFVIGKSHDDDNALRSGNVEKTYSRMGAVPHVDAVIDRSEAMQRLREDEEIAVSEHGEALHVTYKGAEYVILGMGTMDIDLEPDDPGLRNLSEGEKDELLRADTVVVLDMLFGDNCMDSFHLQIKLLNLLVPNMLALMDYTSYRIFSGRQAVMAAASHVPPSPNDMFVIHVVGDEKSDSVWLHTHGLNRCGTIELEILGADRHHYTDLGNVLNEIAYRLIGDSSFIDEMEPLFVGTAVDGRDIVVTWQRSEWSLMEFAGDILGGSADRDEEHSLNMGVIYLYASEEDIKTGRLTPLAEWVDVLTENAIYYKTTEQTERMRALAQERVVYLKKMYRFFAEKTVIVKIGLEPDEPYRTEDDRREFIWFEVDEMEEDHFSATLSQDAFYVEGMVKGVQKVFAYEDIVDWRVFAEDYEFSPDNVYLFERDFAE